MSHDFTRGDRSLFLGECWAVFLHRGIEVDLSTLPELECAYGGERFGDGSETEKSVLAGGDVVLEVSKAEALTPFVFAVPDDCDRDSGCLCGRHELGDCGLNLPALGLRELVFLRPQERTADRNQEDSAVPLSSSNHRSAFEIEG